MSIRVRIEHGQGAGTTWRLTQPGVYVMGRAKASSIQVLDMKVSKEHCEIHLGNDGTSAVLHDLGSTHGAMVNGQPMNGDTPLKPGDELRLGLSILRILSDGAADHDLVPMAGRNMDETSVDTSSATPDAPPLQSLPPDELVGKEMGGYRIEKKIGAGGMGGVYLAEQKSLRRKVALKVLNERFGGDSAFIDQFVNEARAAGALNHPNVVQVYDVGSAHGHHYFSMEVMPGGSIEDRVKDGAVEWQIALNWFLDAANALIFAQKKEILHRDVKPDNLMLAEDGSAKLCDLGLAKKSENKDLMAQGIIGTPHFISPEAIRRKPDVNHRTDLYSLGCSFYRILTGRNPYPGKTVKEILLGHLNKPVPRVSERTDGVPRDLDDVVHKLMQKEPDERFQSSDELLAALDKVRLRHGLEAHGIRPHSRKPLIIAAVVAVAAIAAVGWFATRDREVRVAPKTAQQIEKERQLAITGVRQRVAKAQLEPPGKFNEWHDTVRDKKLRSPGDQWKLDIWPPLLEEMGEFATKWDGTSETWLKEAEKQKHEEAASALRKGAGFMKEQAGKAIALAATHKKYIDGRRKNEKAIAAARTLASSELDAAIEKHRDLIDAAFVDKRYMDAAVALREGDIKALIKPFRERTEKEIVLLDETDINERVKKAFGVPAKGGAFKGRYQPKKLESARDDLRATHEEKMKGLAAPAEATVADLAKLVEGLKEYLATFPALPRSEAGMISLQLVTQRDAVNRAIKQTETRRVKRVLSDYRGDRAGYQDLMRRLFGPRTAGGNGNLRRLGSSSFFDAGMDAKSFADSVKTADYKVVGGHWIRAVEGLKSAFGRGVSTFPKDWVDTKYTYIDQKGREKTKPFKEVTAESFKLGRDENTYEDRSPGWLLKNFFFTDGKPRFALEGDQMLGLATLAELAGDFELARKTYEKYITGVSGEVKQGVQWRLDSLANEERAATTWKSSTKVLGDVEAFIGKYDPKNLAEEDAEAIELFLEKYRPLLQEAQGDRQKLSDDPELAGTLWGSSIRSGDPHPNASFAGERLPKLPGRGPRKDAPKKDDPKKDDPKKDDPKKDDPKKGDPKKGGPKKPDDTAQKQDDAASKEEAGENKADKDDGANGGGG